MTMGDAGTGGGDFVAAYKAILQRVLETRPSGTRQRIAAALGKNRSFVSQITSPSYDTPIPARHVDLIMEICHFSPAERADFMRAYGNAHPQRRPADRSAPHLHAHTIYLPDMANAKLSRKLDHLIGEFVQRLTDIVVESAETPEATRPRKGRMKS